MYGELTCAGDLDHDTLVRGELGDDILAGFAATLSDLGLDPADYLLIPVHPWQWWNRISVTFAGEIAQRRLVCLGPGPDEYLAQQSVRTFFSRTDPARHYVKTALSVLNMGFLRGLSAAYMQATPAINDWIADLIGGDEILKRTGVSIIRERAAIGYRHRQYEAATDRYSPYRKMLASLWREGPLPGLEPGRRLATMASLLHTDRAGRSLAAALIAQSGLAAEVWLRRYLDAYLTPLLHSFYLPPQVRRIRADVPEDRKLLAIFTDVFDCFLRHLHALLATEGVLDEETFWRTVADCVTDYRDSVPELAGRLRRYDLFADEFALSCRNRLQLRDNQRMIDLADPAGALQLVGTLTNPIARFRPDPVTTTCRDHRW